MDLKGLVDKEKWTASQREIDELLHDAVNAHFKTNHGWLPCNQGWCKDHRYFRITLHSEDVFFFEMWDVETDVHMLWDFKILKLDAASLEQVLFGLGI